MRDFKKLRIWQKGFELAVATYKLSAELPADERFGLKSQINRAAVSIPSNVAEGSARNSDKAYKQFIEYSLGSAYELETQLLIIKELELIQGGDLDRLLVEVLNEQRMVSGFLSTLKT